MAITAKDSGSFDRELPTGGLQHAVFSKIHDLGMQLNDYNGQTSYQHKVLVTWELAEVMKEGDYAGKRFVVHKEYTLSLSKKANLRRDLESFKSKKMTDEQAAEGFDLEKLLKVQCTLNLVIATSRGGNDYVKVDGVLPAQSDAPMLVPELPDDWCPEWVKAKIAEGAGAEGDVSKKDFVDDEVPF